jgi:hypothetical protein
MTQRGRSSRQALRRKGRGTGRTAPLPGAKPMLLRSGLVRHGAIAMVGAGIAAFACYPALADEPVDPPADPRISFEAPTPATGAVLTGPQTLRVKAAGDEFTVLKSFKLSIVSDDPAIPPFAQDVAGLATGTFDGTRDQTIQFDWDTSRLTPHNGTYKVVARGRACDFGKCAFDESENTQTLGGLRVNNPPASPQGVQAAVQGTTPVVTWSPGAEPDIGRYVIFRSVAGQARQTVGTTPGATLFSDPCADPLPCPAGATLLYQVQAVRSSPVTPEGIASVASASASVVVPAPPAVVMPVAPAAAVSGQPAAAPPPAKRAAPSFYGDPNDYAPTLPYPKPVPAAPTAPPSTEPAPVAAPAPTVTASSTAVAIPERLETPKALKIRYIAGTLILLILATLLARSAGMALSRDPKNR